MESAVFKSTSYFTNCLCISTLVSPNVIPRDGTSTIAVTTNTSVTISFNITAFPPVEPSDIQWYFQSTRDDFVEIFNNTNRYVFSSDKNSLTISDVQSTDAGTYRITTSNIVGSIQTDVTLVVIGMLLFIQV